MKNFNREDRFGGEKRFDRDRGFRREERSDRPTMHQATCAQCGKECHVPFKPTGDKPVFCSDCFGKKESFGRKENFSDNRFQRRDSVRSSDGSKKMFKAVCDKCRRECEVPFKPTGDKPVFCSDCFSKSDKIGGGSNFSSHSVGNFKSNNGAQDQSVKQLEILNNKLDNILKILTASSRVEKIVETGLLTVSAPKKIANKKMMTPEPVNSKKVIKKVVKKELKKIIIKKKK